jgi:hypothetical protein
MQPASFTFIRVGILSLAASFFLICANSRIESAFLPHSDASNNDRKPALHSAEVPSASTHIMPFGDSSARKVRTENARLVQVNKQSLEPKPTASTNAADKAVPPAASATTGTAVPNKERIWHTPIVGTPDWQREEEENARREKEIQQKMIICKGC